MSLAASICICTYNGVSRVGDVLAALARQTLDGDAWEALVIDNASSDGTGDLAGQLIKEKLGGHGRVAREEQPGLSFARARAAREARGEIICFLDDDNVPAPDFAAAAVHAFRERPKAAVIGGKVLARWETQPTPLAAAVAPFALAICDHGDTPELLIPTGGGIVGAGMCVRRELLNAIFSSTRLAASVTDRTGSNLVGGGDLAVSVLARQMGWECWYVPTLQIEHILPVGRMQKGYLLRLYHGIGRGQSAIRRLYDWKARSPLAWLIAGKDLARWLRGRYRGPTSLLHQAYPSIADDLHDLNQSLVWGRGLEALRFL